MKKARNKTPTKMGDIAKRAGVSVSTVSRALAGSPLVARKSREEIVELARESGYVINAAARNLRLRRSEAISVVFPLAHETGQPLTDPFFIEMLGHLANEITHRGYGLLLQKILPPMDDWLPRLIASRRSDGIVVIGQSTEHAALKAAAASYLPLVVWGGHVASQSYCTVGTDNIGGARLGVEHLIRLGRRRIVFFGDPSPPEIKLRHDGYVMALKKARVALDAPHIVPTHLTSDAAFEAMRAFIGRGRPFDALFAGSDLIATSAVRALIAAGVRVPEDVAVVGFDDISLASQVQPALTTLRQDIRYGAKTLVDLVFRRMAGENAPSVTLPAELIVRESCGAANSRAR